MNENCKILTGNEACTLGAIAAGMRFFAGYPITPATEIAEISSELLPKCGGRVLVQSITTKPAEGALLEAHKNFLDIQYIPEATETMGWAPIEKLENAKPYNPDKDVWHFAGECDLVDIRPGYCYVVYPEDAHAPGVHRSEAKQYSKIVVKLPCK